MFLDVRKNTRFKKHINIILKGVSMRSEQIKEMFQSFIEDNDEKFMKVATEIIEDERKKKHHLLVKDLRKIIASKNQNQFIHENNIVQRYKSNIPIPRDSEKGFPLLEIKENYFSLDDLILETELKSKIERIPNETKFREILATYGLKPKQKFLFCGPPGTGKTLTANVISSIIGYPLVHIRFDSIVSSFLGETATNLRKVFDFIEKGEWVVLFDEFDVIGKKRDDPYEHGETKRVVNNFMQMLDSYRGRSILIAATNHEHLLDSAIWRRFDEILYYDIPDENLREKIFKKYLQVMNKSKDLDMLELSKLSEGFSPADISQVCQEALRRNIMLNKKEINLDDIKLIISEQKKRKEIIKQV
ncbi:MAG: ATP-binding protein [Methanolobus sp.]|nr:ATP-binding protein [Methanolobus sp.]